MGSKKESQTEPRRDFMKVSAAAAVAASFASIKGAYAQGKDQIKVGLVGCGGRGTGAAVNALEADPAVNIVAMADVFEDRLNQKYDLLQKEAGKHKWDASRVAVPESQRFLGFDSYKKVIDLDLDYVILATPPCFRPVQLAYAVEQGRNIFTEKPVAVDPVGAKSVMKSYEDAKAKGLSVAAGTQRRHQQNYIETYNKVREGAIGKITNCKVNWDQGELWYRKNESNWKPMEWMIRDWVNWRWLSGDHIVEQHVHNIDVANWFMSPDNGSAHPIKAVGRGGRAHRKTGDQWDFFAVDFEYPDDVHVASYCRQINGCANNVSEMIVGEKGIASAGEIKGANPWRFRTGRGQKVVNPYVQEHIDLIDSIRNNKKLNELHNVATSTLTAIMGREASYSGREITWDEIMSSDLSLTPESISYETPLVQVIIPVQGRA